MFVLALDTSTPACSVALLKVDADAGLVRRVAGSSVVDARRHGEVLAPSVQAVLAEARVSATELAAIVAGAGPGPYTSLRVGVVTAAAIGQALNIPAYGVCSLDAVPGCPDQPSSTDPPGGRPGVRDPAETVSGAVPTTWAAVTDARRREVFWAVYRNGSRVSGPAVAAPALVAEQLRARRVTRVVGPGVAAYPSAFEGFEGFEGCEGPESLEGSVGRVVYPDPVLLARLVLPDLAGGVRPAPLAPIYLRRPDAAEPQRPSVVIG